MSTERSVSSTLRKLNKKDEFDIRSPAGANPNTTWAVRDFIIEDKSYRVAVEELPMDSGDNRYTLAIKRLDADEQADVFRLFSIPNKMNSYQWLRDHMLSTLASKHTTLDGACAYIQDNLGVTDGMFAGQYFSDDELAQDFKNQKTMHAYLLSEERFNETDHSTGAMLMEAYQTNRYAPGLMDEMVENLQQVSQPIKP